jgi:hypothetical protein
LSGMHVDNVVMGMRVRYPRTGTTGTVQHIETVRGDTFAALDSTHLLYRIDQLIPAADYTPTVRNTIIEDAKKVIEQEREFAAGSGLQDALKNIDQSCEGGG